VAFCSVAVFRPYADEELRYCLDSLPTAGLKLHLAASGADLTDEVYPTHHDPEKLAFFLKQVL